MHLIPCALQNVRAKEFYDLLMRPYELLSLIFYINKLCVHLEVKNRGLTILTSHNSTYSKKMECLHLRASSNSSQFDMIKEFYLFTDLPARLTRNIMGRFFSLTYFDL